MYLKGLDELDRKILDLLTQNARYTYSELGERLGLSRVAIKNRMDALEERGIIEGYTVIVNPQKLGSAVSCYYECCLHIHAVAADQEELERLMNEVLDRLPGVEKLTTRVILSRVKDVKGLRL